MCWNAESRLSQAAPSSSAPKESDLQNALPYFTSRDRSSAWRARCCSPKRSRPAAGGKVWLPCYCRNSLLRWTLTHSLNSAMCSEGAAVSPRFHRAVTHPLAESRAARIIRFATAESVGHAATTRASSGSVSATDINCLQPFSTVSVTTIGTTTLEIPAFSRCFPRSTSLLKNSGFVVCERRDQVASAVCENVILNFGKAS